MTLVLEHEVVPGLVAFADPEVMHAANVCRTNMPHEHVLGIHPFLVVDVDTGGVVTVLPLFSRPLPSRVLLDESRKRGLSFKWRHRESYFYKWEFWRAPVAVFCAATEEEATLVGDRRHYVDDGRGYREIRAFEGCNKNPYRLLTRSPEAAT